MYVIILSQAVVTPDGSVTQVVGPFSSYQAATKWSWQKENLWAAVPGEITEIAIVREKYDA